MPPPPASLALPPQEARGSLVDICDDRKGVSPMSPPCVSPKGNDKANPNPKKSSIESLFIFKAKSNVPLREGPLERADRSPENTEREKI